MANLSVPVIITSVLEMLPSIVTIVLVGRVEDGHGGPVGELGGEGTTTSMQQLHLDAAALAVMLINVVCFAPVAGECKILHP
jgi:Na+-driven multidrug efflux pump